MDEALQHLMFGTSICNKEDFDVAVRPMQNRKSNSRHADMWRFDNNIDPRLILVRLWLWRVASDMMPGESTLWLLELRRELAHRNASNECMPTSLVDADDVCQLIPYLNRVSKSGAEVSSLCRHDIPRPNGTNQYKTTQRCIGLHDHKGKVRWELFECDSAFQGAWCRFVWKSCREHVALQWSRKDNGELTIPKGHIVFGDRDQKYTMQQVSSIVFLVPDNCTKVVWI